MSIGIGIDATGWRRSGGVWVPPGFGADLRVWFSPFTSDVGAVSQWDDVSGNDNHLVQATGTKQPTTTGSTPINGWWGVKGDGTDDDMQTGSAVNDGADTAWSIAVVYEHHSGSPDRWWGAGFMLSGATTTDRAAGGYSVSHTPTAHTGGPHLYLHTADFVADDYQVRLDGAGNGSSSTATANIGVGGVMELFNVGGSGAGWTSLTIYEVLVWNAVLDGSEVADVESNLLAKYGIA